MLRPDYNQLGSTVALTDATGEVAGTYTYDAMGNVTSHTGGDSTPIGFAGGYTDASGLIYLVHRYYDPSTGQFLSVDPLVQQTKQAYQYAGNDPVNASDPSGDITCPSYVPGCGVVTDIHNGVSGAVKGLTHDAIQLVHELGSAAADLTQALGAEASAFYNYEAKTFAADVSLLKSAATWVYQHRNIIPTIGAIAVCVAPGIDLVGCGIATAVAFGIRAQQRGWSAKAFEADSVDFVLTAVSFGLVTVPSSLALGEAPDALYQALGLDASKVPELTESAVAKYILKASL